MQIVACDHSAVWNRYVFSHPFGGPFHLFGWKEIIETVYRLTTFYLMAVDRPVDCFSTPDADHHRIRGILALAMIHSPGNRRRLVSLPYVDVAGGLADDPASEARLLEEAIRIAGTGKARWIELRQPIPLKCLAPENVARAAESEFNLKRLIRHWQVSSHKNGLQRPLPEDAQQLLHAFKSKLRSQIKKAFKNGLTHEVGGAELLPAFYHVFSRNMRDLGSPVHPYRLFQAVFDTFGEGARVALVRRGSDPAAAAIVLRYGNRLHNPWASAVKDFRSLGTNMLLYWAMLAHACDRGLTIFDFGRSSPGAGTFNFKRQWEARPTPLYWYYLTLSGDPVDPLAESLSFAAWKRLPVWLSRLVCPHVRRHISL